MKIRILLFLSCVFLYVACKGDCEDYTFGVEPCKEGENCVEITPLNIDAPLIIYTEKEYLIETDSAYNELQMKEKGSNIPHSKVEWPSVDFSKNMLLGKKVSYGGGTLIGTSYKCIKTEKTYTFHITNVSSGNEDILSIELKWILIPKIKVDSSKIEFNVKEVRCRK